MWKRGVALVASHHGVVAIAEGIDTVVVFMLENRAFDHMLGFLKKADPRINGCLPGDCLSPEDPSDPQSPMVTVEGSGIYVSEADPDHSIHGTTFEIFGSSQQAPWPSDPPMSGFVKRYNHGNTTDYGRHIMKCFEPEQVPAISTLAQEFALFDRWFVSVPGPTMPNRAFSLSATSHGIGTNDKEKIALGWPQKSIFKALDEKGIDWRVYFQEVPTALAFSDMRNPGRLLKYRQFESFLSAAKKGDLPAFSWIDPRYFGLSDSMPATDQHPNHPVDAGDRLIKEIYEAVRNGPKWNSTLLLITYDEHGGWYDHVPPPAGPSPDGLNSTDDPFDFTRLGVRVPTIAVSPLIPKNTLVSEPGTGGTSAKPGSEFDATSMIATVRRLYGLPEPLTRRDAWAASFEGVISLEEPRTDCPTTLPSPPVHDDLRQRAGGQPLSRPGLSQLNELQSTFIDMIGDVTGGPPEINAILNEGNAGLWVHQRISDYICTQTDGQSPLCSTGEASIV